MYSMSSYEERREALIERIAERVRERGADFDAAHLELAETFARRSYIRRPLSDLERSPLDELAAACLALLDAGETRLPGHHHIRLTEPPVHGEGPTAIDIVTDDMPFLVDSISGELNRRELPLHSVLHPQLTVRRDGEGRLLGLAEEDVEEPGAVKESFMRFELDPITNRRILVELETSLAKVLADVRLAVEDWQPMREVVRRAASDLRFAPSSVPVEEATDSRTFLEWLDEHFTMLGYLEYELVHNVDGEHLRPVPGSGLGLRRTPTLEARANADKPLAIDVAHFFDDSRQVLKIWKSTQRATVHRPVYMDLVSIKRFKDGKVVGEGRLVGLFTSMAYSVTASRIPWIRRKVERVLHRANLLPASHDAKAMRHIVEHYPRDELFQISEDELYDFALRILDLQLRPRLALMVRRDEAERFISCMLFVPRDRHSTRLRLRIQRLLEGIFHGKVSAFSTKIVDAPLAQLHFVIQVRPGELGEVDVAKIEELLGDAIRTWSDSLQRILIERHGRERGLEIWGRYGEAFPVSYQERVSPNSGCEDLQIVESMHGGGEHVAMRLYHRDSAASNRFRFRTFELGEPAPLSDLLPKLENMGLKVLSEIPFEILPLGAPQPYWVRSFDVETFDEVDLEKVQDSFQEAFKRVWAGELENDGFNRLVACAGLAWRQVVLLRTYCKYLLQAGIAFSQPYMEETLARHPRVAALLVELFETFFDPARGEDNREIAAMPVLDRLQEALDMIQSRDEDRILRRFLNLVQSTLRTNYYQLGEDGESKPYLSIKFDAKKVHGLPNPRPMSEIFVYSPDVEAVHLRGGKVARGGIRWSDRREDFRTEVLGLVKSQMVKNAVIVPVGAKGGFVVKRPPEGGDREAWLTYGIECYKTMIRGLLDITDNLRGDEVLTPPRTLRRDPDDPYLVVAADKGTATFSDIANGVAAEYDFWLGDAFASGGSQGYDHKAMAITARGAWESVKRHFREMGGAKGREMGHDIQREDFTVVGVGDMSGDVFGNGMLLSEHLRLVAAFNHLHIFIDPEPDAATSFAERRRLFDLPRSTWADYDRSLLSPGGEIYDRSAKTLQLTPEIQKRFGLKKSTVSPAKLMQTILRAEVDLLWFGGIGTYVKASSETNAKVGDRANDELRVDGAEVRAKVIGEGANLGLTQAGRIEYALAGGRLNTDFIDNSGGVDCSDHEVNIKIVLADATASGELDGPERSKLLAAMTDEVAELVLRDNYLQSQSITLTEHEGWHLLDEQSRLMADLERAGALDRRLEGLPDDAGFVERREAKKGLTRPEIAILLAASKIFVYNELLDSPLPDEEQLIDDLVRYFPIPMRERFRPMIERHRLRREIIATHVTNSIINRVGPTFVPQMAKATGRTVSDIARAYTAAREVLELRSLWEDVEKLDNLVPARLQIETLRLSVELVERVTRWFLRHGGDDISGCCERYAGHILVVAAQLEDMLPKAARRDLEKRYERYVMAGMPMGLAARVAGLDRLHAACDVARSAVETGKPVEDVGCVYFTAGERFGVDQLARSASELGGASMWQQEALAELLGDLGRHQAELTQRIVTETSTDAASAVAAWTSQRDEAIERLDQLLADFKAVGHVDLAMLTVAERELRRLAEGD